MGTNNVNIADLNKAFEAAKLRQQEAQKGVQQTQRNANFTRNGSIFNEKQGAKTGAATNTNNVDGAKAELRAKQELAKANLDVQNSTKAIEQAKRTNVAGAENLANTTGTTQQNVDDLKAQLAKMDLPQEMKDKILAQAEAKLAATEQHTEARANMNGAQLTQDDMKMEGMTLRDQAIAMTNKSNEWRGFSQDAASNMSVMQNEMVQKEAQTNDIAKETEDKAEELKREIENLKKQIEKDKTNGEVDPAKTAKLEKLAGKMDSITEKGQEKIEREEGRLDTMRGELQGHAETAQNTSDFGKETKHTGQDLMRKSGLMYSKDFFTGIRAMRTGMSADSTGKSTDKIAVSTGNDLGVSLNVVREDASTVREQVRDAQSLAADATMVKAEAAVTESTGETENTEDKTAQKTEQTTDDTQQPGGFQKKKVPRPKEE